MIVDVDPDDIDALIKAHMSLAKSVAYRAWNRARHALEYDDIEGWAYEGLVEAANRWREYCANHKPKPFDYKDVHYFATYAQRRIHGNIYDNLRSADKWAGRGRRTRAKEIQQADQGMGLSEKEIAEITGLTVKEIRANNAAMAQKPISFESGLSDLYEPVTTDVASLAESSYLVQVAVEAIKDCTYEQQIVLALHYYKNRDLRDVAKEMGIPEQHASKLHTAAVMAIFETVKLEAEED